MTRPCRRWPNAMGIKSRGSATSRIPERLPRLRQRRSTKQHRDTDNLDDPRAPSRVEPRDEDFSDLPARATTSGLCALRPRGSGPHEGVCVREAGAGRPT